MKVTLTLKNYRCFVRPTTIEVAKGFTAFVGVNNAGKSTLMRFLLEFRSLLQRIIPDGGNFLQSLRGIDQVQPIHVLDLAEVFSNLNGDGLEFWLDFEYDAAEDRTKLPRQAHFTYARNAIWQTKITTREGQVFGPVIPNAQFENSTGLNARDGRSVELKPLFDATNALARTLIPWTIPEHSQFGLDG